MAEGFLTEIDAEIFANVLKLAKKEIKSEKNAGKELAPAFESFLEQIVRYATGEDHYWSQPELLLKRAKISWENAAVRKLNSYKLSFETIENGDRSAKRIIMDIVADDKPFLVDSVSAALFDIGSSVAFFSNSVVDIVRDEDGNRLCAEDGSAVRESIIHAELDDPATDGGLDGIRDEISTVLDDVYASVADWESMRARLATCIAQLEKSRIPGIESKDQKETIAFLKWLWDNKFVFLGVRSYDYQQSKSGDGFTHSPDQDLGILKDSSRRILKSTFLKDGTLAPAIQGFLDSNEPVIVAKANAVSCVHRRAHMDYIGVKKYSIDGRVIGEDRFVGLFSSDAYNHPATEIPLVRAKVEKVLDDTAFNPGGHNEKALINILETFPRDELFQIDVDALREISLGILRLYKRPRVKLFLRRDRFDRFVSALVFIPRDRFNSGIREEVGQLLASSFNGYIAAFTPFFGDASLVRVHYIVAIDTNAPIGPSAKELSAQVQQLCVDWDDLLLEALLAAGGQDPSAIIFQKYRDAFSEGYKEKNEIAEVLTDLSAFERLSDQETVVRVFRFRDDNEAAVRLKIYRRDNFFALSDLIPTIENLGLNVIQESCENVRPADNEHNRSYWVHDFFALQKNGNEIDLDSVKDGVAHLLLAVLAGQTEDDGFNGLALTAGLDWREASLLRACAKYNLQCGFSFSQSYMQEALLNNADIARTLIGAFHARFNPDGTKKPEKRKEEWEAARASVLEMLQSVQSLDEDLIVRQFLVVFSAITRVNYYQSIDGQPKPYISFKIDSHLLPELPKPKPFREIFVSGPVVDGVHLRFGPISRGGLRWSDRREDFRTEVLGLVKAQRVKNAVIVPNGSKGGFYPKQLPITDDRNAIYEAGRSAYKEFIRGLLDLTDNVVSGKIISPDNLVIWDDPDPYLVVAADKGTAQFSDTANAISEEYGFWLGDAFASGGTVGYDHKAMGITARGAWVAVQRHFREMGKDIQSEPFTAAGVGDMSGDVFGNGMLLSDKTRLIAAFDHRDIFIDPDPDPTTSFQERKRLFELPRSSWRDYDEDKISKGGGVFSRNLKTIKISSEAATALGVDKTEFKPNELIKSILRAPIELFWLGGIGTYFKAEDEENIRVGDRGNDQVRIDISSCQAKVIGEGANLGLTQKARIEFAKQGGRINTDAVDNSAGVDSSDHEVNIKILLSAAIENAELKREDRDELLRSMTDDVADHVLVHNYDQTRAITLLESEASQNLDVHSRFMTTLENKGRLDRAIEFLPATDEIANLRQRELGLTRPELSVLLAYAKLWLFDELVESHTPDDPIFEEELFRYFPGKLSVYSKSILSHQLKREIIATRIANEIVDTCGLGFVQHVAETASVDFSGVALAYEATRRIYDLRPFAEAINDLDNKVSADLQTKLFLEASTLLQEQVFHILSVPATRESVLRHGVKPCVNKYKIPIAEFKKSLPEILPQTAAVDYKQRFEDWKARGVPEDIAEIAASLPVLEHALDIVNLAMDTGWSNPAVGGLYFAVGRLFGLDVLISRSRMSPPQDHYDKIAIRQIAESLSAKQRDLTSLLIKFAGAEPNGKPSIWIEKLTAQWVESHKTALDEFNETIVDLDLLGHVGVGRYTLMLRKLEDLMLAVDE